MTAYKTGYKTGDGSVSCNFTYDTYGNSQWGDLLTGYDGRTFSYDAIGNLTNDGIRTYTWKHGRQLATLSDSTTTWQYTYNADGLRTRKTDGATTYSYVYNGGQLTQMTVGTDTLYFSYDATGRPMTVTHNGTVYHYVLSLQGDVLFILDGSENMAASYVYDAWGNTIAGYHSSTLGTLNPLRYRGYVYDTETELYYLQSRYYNPEIGRFTNADLQLNTSLGILGLNLYTYCLNNPVNKADYVGNKPGDLFDTPDEAARDFAEYINAKSIAVNREYASYIYEATVTQTKTITYINPNILGNGPLSWLWRLIFGKGFTRTVTVKVKTTKYTYVEPIQGTKDSCIIPINWFGRHKQVGLLHTHAAYDPLYANDIFSSEDKELAHRRGLPIYVATPIGNLRRFNPFDGTDIILFSDIPFDPNHPWRRWR